MEKKLFFISADIEGVTDVTSWEETQRGALGYEEASRQMSLEVGAACEAILAAGHDVVVRDAHDSARNIKHDLLPRGTKLMRGWANHPGGMMAGVDEKYAGALFIGYHAPGGSDENPLAHTTSNTTVRWIRINGKLASEFTMNRLFAAEQGVPALLITGDAGICRRAKEEVPTIHTVAVKECRGGSTFNMHPLDAIDAIRKETTLALADLESIQPVTSAPYEVIACLVNHQTIRNSLAHPEVEQIDANTVRFTARTARELCSMWSWIRQ